MSHYGCVLRLLYWKDGDNNDFFFKSIMNLLPYNAVLSRTRVVAVLFVLVHC